MISKILDSVKYVVENSKHVHVNEANLQKFCNQLETARFVHWLERSPCLLTLPKDKYLNFLFILNSISFCYWQSPKWAIVERGEKIDGAWGMICALMKALRNGYPITDFNYLNDISYDQFEKFFNTSMGKLPLLNDRFKILKVLSKEMIKSFDGSPLKLIQSSNNDASIFLNKLVFHFPYFDDYSKFKSKPIYFYKKAQLLISDIDYLLRDDKNYRFLKNVDRITACADYKIPFVFRNLEILEYSNELDHKIKNGEIIESDSIEEIEIRASTIWVIELMKIHLNNMGRKILSTELNDYVWLLSQEKNIYSIPYHHTMTTKY